MCRARKTIAINAMLRCKPVVKNFGQPALWTRRAERTPSTTTPLSRISEAAPAPLVVYQRSVSLTAVGYEPPETATGELDEVLTVPDDDWRPLEDEVDALELVALVAVEDEAETPGIVISLMAPKMPTPARAAKTMPAVIVVSSDRARSRALILAAAAPAVCIGAQLHPSTQSSL